jgi:hypothetical protein
MADTLNITIDQNATFVQALQWLDSNDSPVNLTGYAARLVVKSAYEAAIGQAILDISSGSGGSGDTTGIALDSSGNITVVVAKATTATLVPGKYVYDLLLTAGGGRATRLVQGDCLVTAGVTP